MEHLTPSIKPKTAPRAHHQPETDRASMWGSEIARWGFFLTGVVLILAAAVLPLRADLEWTRHQRNLAAVSEQEHLFRNERYSQMIGAIESQDPHTIGLLAQSNLGMIPSNRSAIVMSGPMGQASSDPMVFELLEPPMLERPEFAPRYSRLERLVMVPRTRLWVIAGGIFLVFVGLLPAARAKSS